jgi:hypothetical protein
MLCSVIDGSERLEKRKRCIWDTSEVQAMRFAFGGYEIEVEPSKLETVGSIHTGRALRRGEIEIRGRDQGKEALEALRKDSVLTDPATGQEWRIIRRTHSMSRSDSPVVAYGFEIEENEKRSADTIEFAGLSLRPERYNEEARDGALSIKRPGCRLPGATLRSSAPFYVGTLRSSWSGGVSLTSRAKLPLRSLLGRKMSRPTKPFLI